MPSEAVADVGSASLSLEPRALNAAAGIAYVQRGATGYAGCAVDVAAVFVEYAGDALVTLAGGGIGIRAIGVARAFDAGVERRRVRWLVGRRCLAQRPTWVAAALSAAGAFDTSGPGKASGSAGNRAAVDVRDAGSTRAQRRTRCGIRIGGAVCIRQTFDALTVVDATNGAEVFLGGTVSILNAANTGEWAG